MSASHGHSTMGGMEYDDRGYVRRQKRRKSHIDVANQRAMEIVSASSATPSWFWSIDDKPG